MAPHHQLNHVLGPAAYSAHAIALGAADEAGVGEAEIRWAIAQASPAVRHVVQRMPARAQSKTRFGTLFYLLDTGLRR